MLLSSCRRLPILASFQMAWSCYCRCLTVWPAERIGFASERLFTRVVGHSFCVYENLSWAGGRRSTGWPQIRNFPFASTAEDIGRSSLRTRVLALFKREFKCHSVGSCNCNLVGNRLSTIQYWRQCYWPRDVREGEHWTCFLVASFLQCQLPLAKKKMLKALYISRQVARPGVYNTLTLSILFKTWERL